MEKSMSDYEAVIGLEVHAQLLTESKIFCGCSTKFGAEPNTQTCPVCLGMPGVLPVFNKRVAEFAIRLALATNSTIRKFSQFARKNYFYPDLPKNYQISMYELPLAEDGYIEIKDGEKIKKIRIKRIHMEEDAGKNIHDEAITEGNYSFVDLNRAAVPLLEIVSEPDINSPQEAVQYLKKLRNIVIYLGICDGNMQEGSFRCDANVSVRRRGEKELGVKTEIKNMNSFRFIERALSYEIERQVKALERGERIVQETRLWDEKSGKTCSMRSKEYAHDYRYFPEPDLLPLVVDEKWIDEIRASLPELPDKKAERFKREYGLPDYDVNIIVSSKALSEYFEKCVKLYPKPKTVSNWILTELLRLVNLEENELNIPLPPEDLAELLKLIGDGTISGKIAKDVFEESFNTGKKPSEIVRLKGLVQISDEDTLTRIASNVIEKFPKQVQEYRSGKEKLIGFLVGQVMKETQGKGNPQKVNEILTKLLKGGKTNE
jgi:aspartyl-tRNA(Asn)/glutamyl-tRNA(Gln) amidotransferase subunit B